ncbi:hypothetical protein GCM10028895_45900 [Pontibacter rugosus]
MFLKLQFDYMAAIFIHQPLLHSKYTTNKAMVHIVKFFNNLLENIWMEQYNALNLYRIAQARCEDDTKI